MADESRGPTVTDEEILAVFENTDDEPLQTGDVADDLPIPEHELRERLDDLHERDLVVPADGDLPGEQWRLTTDGRAAVDVPEEELESDVEAQATKTTDVAASTRDEETPATPPPDPDADPSGDLAASPMAEVEAFAGAESPAVERERRSAIREVYGYLRQHGPATREDLQDDVFPDASGGYPTPEEWWDDLVRPGLDTLPGVNYREADDAYAVSVEGDATSVE